MSGYSRRDFLRGTTALGALAAAAAAASAQDKKGKKGKNDKASPDAKTFPTEGGKTCRVAFIGTGGKGASHVKEMHKFGAQCPCFCDVDKNKWTEAGKNWPDAKPYQDYRKMLEAHKNEIDAVVVATPDHHHYPATILALNMGKHCYTQKPLTHTVWEARMLAEAAAKAKVATQMGNQGHANEGWRLLYEWIHGGAIGEVKEVHTWTNRPIWPQGTAAAEAAKGAADTVPDNIDWDVWVGPAPMRPYKEKVYHPFKWRGFWEFGGGSIADMGCHTFDGVFFALQPKHPSSVEVVAIQEHNDNSFPASSVVKWEFPSNGKFPAFTAYWYDKGQKPKAPPELEGGRELPKTGNLFIGSKGTILCSGDYGDSVRIIPEAKMKEIGKPKQMLERSPGHVQEWWLAITGQKPVDFPKSNFGYAGPITETMALANVALRVNKKIVWDGEAMKVTNCPEAQQYISKEYRAGWKF